MQATNPKVSASASAQTGSQELGENPKDRIGITKPPLHLVPAASMLHQAEAMRNGADKYGAYNWRTKKVKSTIYVSAAQRHIAQWLDGEEVAEDSGVHHLGHALACLGILLDAQATGNLVDDRPVAGAASKVIGELTKKPDAPTPWSDDVLILTALGIPTLSREEDDEARRLGEADADSRPEYTHAGPFGEKRPVAEPVRRNAIPVGSMDVADCDATLRGARRGKDEALSEARYQYGVGAGR